MSGDTDRWRKIAAAGYSITPDRLTHMADQLDAHRRRARLYDIAAAVAAVGFAGGVAAWMLLQTGPPQVTRGTAEVTITVEPTATVTVTEPGPTRTITVSRDRDRQPAGGVLARIRWCESRNNYQAENPTSTASGAYQMLDGTWRGLGYTGRAKDAPPAVQDAAALRLYQQLGAKPWNASRGCWS